MIQEEPRKKGASASFCVPRAAIHALLEAKASNVVIGAYLTLARFTESSGMYSSASISALNDYMSLNKGKAKKAIATLAAITFKHGAGKQARNTALVYERHSWLTANGGVALPDGPHERAMIRHVLPDFGELLEDRVWFSNNLVSGYGRFTLPLKRLKNAGEFAGQLLLAMYRDVDMTTYGGVSPHIGPWVRYENAGQVIKGPARIIHAKRKGHIGTIPESIGKEGYFAALEGLEGSGFFYEVVTVLNRNPTQSTFKSGEKYGDIPADAEPLYELDARSYHGFKPTGEMGLGGLTAKTSGELGYSVAAGEVRDDYGRPVETGFKAGQFMGKYAAIVPRGMGAMIVGIYRPRFRVSNPKNAGVKDAWVRIHSSNREGLEWINGLRKSAGLEEQPMPAKPIEADKPEWSEVSVH